MVPNGQIGSKFLRKDHSTIAQSLVPNPRLHHQITVAMVSSTVGSRKTTGTWQGNSTDFLFLQRMCLYDEILIRPFSYTTGLFIQQMFLSTCFKRLHSETLLKFIMLYYFLCFYGSQQSSSWSEKAPSNTEERSRRRQPNNLPHGLDVCPPSFSFAVRANQNAVTEIQGRSETTGTWTSFPAYGTAVTSPTTQIHCHSPYTKWVRPPREPWNFSPHCFKTIWKRQMYYNTLSC